MGKTGAGKSSLCNALFQGEVTPISNTGACTREALHFRLRNGNHSLMVVDLPSVGENEQRDEEYSTLYRHILPELDLVLWVTRTTGAAPPHQGCHRYCCFYCCLLRGLRGNQVYITGCIKRHVLPGLNLTPRYGNLASGRFYRDVITRTQGAAGRRPTRNLR